MTAHLDEDAFPRFAPLLAASQRYMAFRKFRFQHCDFDSLPDPASAGIVNQESMLAASLEAAPFVAHFEKLLNSAVLAHDRATPEQQALLDELGRAAHIEHGETVRKNMISRCKGLCMFPPTGCLPVVESNDCCYQDVSSPFPVIAQRLYNEERMSNQHVQGYMHPFRRRVLTAFFIVDFAQGVGVAVPEMPQLSGRFMLAEFEKRVSEWQARDDVPSNKGASEGHPEGSFRLPNVWRKAIQATGAVATSACAVATKVSSELRDALEDVQDPLDAGDCVESLVARPEFKPRPLNIGDVGTVIGIDHRRNNSVLVMFNGDPPMDADMRHANLRKIEAVENGRQRRRSQEARA